MNLNKIVLGLVILSSLAAAPVFGETLVSVRVEGIKQMPGEVGIAVYHQPQGYPTHLEQAYETEWIPLKTEMETVTAEFDSLEPGEYALSVLHDTNGNRQVDRSLLGFPKEGVGFSNNCRVYLSAPKFKNCKFTLAEGEKKKITIRLEYQN